MFGTLFCTQVVMLCYENIDSDYHATKVVLTLMEDLLHKGHFAYIGNWYTPIKVCNVLNNNTTDVIGTLRRDRKDITDAFVKKGLKQGETIVQYEHKMGLAITHWKDERDVFMITTCILDSKTIVQTRGVKTTLPTVIHTYNNIWAALTEATK